MNIHALAILKAIMTCHAECAGMDAENTLRAGQGNGPAYGMEHYLDSIARMDAIYEVNRDWVQTQ